MRTRCTLFALLSLALSMAACSHNIGDDCMTSVDCDPNGVWSCDLSQPGGYCTLVGCDPVTAICPGGSTCIRLFPLNLLPGSADLQSKDFMKSCDPTAPASSCAPGLVCSSAGHCAQCDPACEDVSCAGRAPQNQCLADEICLDVGLCAKESLEQRQCAKSCSSNSDCRSGYECRVAGLGGSMVLASDPNAKTSFCAPKAPPTP